MEERPPADGLVPEPSPRLGEDLARLYGEAVPIPPGVDAAIRARARQHFAPRAPRLRWAWTAGLAAAAALLFALFLTRPVDRSPSPPPTLVSTVTLRREDIDRNGRVNILDAYLVARRLETGAAPDLWDLNADGSVDRRDVDLVAMAAVRVDGGTLR